MTFEIPELAAVARPGDTLMVSFNRTLADEELDDLREGFQQFTESTGVHIAFVEQASGLAVLRPTGEAVTGA